MPEEPGAVVRCIVESLALKFRFTIELLSRVTGVSPPEVHIVGGGARNRLLVPMLLPTPRASRSWQAPRRQRSSETCSGRRLRSASLRSLEEARAVVRASFEPTLFEPTRQAEWDGGLRALRARSSAVPERGAGHEAVAR